MPEASNSNVHGCIHGKTVTYFPATPEALKKMFFHERSLDVFNSGLVNRNTINIKPKYHELTNLTGLTPIEQSEIGLTGTIGIV